MREETKQSAESHPLGEKALRVLQTAGVLDRSKAHAESSRRTGHEILAYAGAKTQNQWDEKNEDGEKRRAWMGKSCIYSRCGREGLGATQLRAYVFAAGALNSQIIAYRQKPAAVLVPERAVWEFRVKNDLLCVGFEQELVLYWSAELVFGVDDNYR